MSAPSHTENTTTASRDFRPKAGADTIDNGTTDSTNAATDLIGTSRPSGSAYDIGAEEYVTVGGGSSIVPILNTRRFFGA